MTALTDEDLEKVSGGEVIFAAIMSACLSVGAWLTGATLVGGVVVAGGLVIAGSALLGSTMVGAIAIGTTVAVALSVPVIAGIVAGVELS